LDSYLLGIGIIITVITAAGREMLEEGALLILACFLQNISRFVADIKNYSCSQLN